LADIQLQNFLLSLTFSQYKHHFCNANHDISTPPPKTAANFFSAAAAKPNFSADFQ